MVIFHRNSGFSHEKWWFSIEIEDFPMKNGDLAIEIVDLPMKNGDFP